jgi:endonuclease YncB( thermonuclease family)
MDWIDAAPLAGFAAAAICAALALAWRPDWWSPLRRRAAPPKPFRGKVFVLDGDTIVVRRQRVRLHGIDAPELTQAGGFRARSHLIRMAGGREGEVLPVGVDRYGRVVAKVRLGTIDISDRMARDGYAIAMSDFDPDYAPAELYARRRRCGLWAGRGIDDPGYHRKRMAQESETAAPVIRGPWG